MSTWNGLPASSWPRVKSLSTSAPAPWSCLELRAEILTSERVELLLGEFYRGEFWRDRVFVALLRLVALPAASDLRCRCGSRIPFYIAMKRREGVKAIHRHRKHPDDRGAIAHNWLLRPLRRGWLTQRVKTYTSARRIACKDKKAETNSLLPVQKNSMVV